MSTRKEYQLLGTWIFTTIIFVHLHLSLTRSLPLALASHFTRLTPLPFSLLPPLPNAVARTGSPSALFATLTYLPAWSPSALSELRDLVNVLETFFVEEAVCEVKDGFFEGVGCKNFG
jgi:hypothetical protein